MDRLLSRAMQGMCIKKGLFPKIIHLKSPGLCGHKLNRIMHIQTIRYLLIIFCVATVLAACSSPQPVVPMVPTPRPDRLAFPPTVDNPTQADLGEHIYFQVCMACHGDFGQGLTEEWRDIWDEDKDCWQPECHGPDHPDYGFEIEKTCCPAVFGNGTLIGFDNAMELFQYTADEMPWWAKGSLTREEYWQVTAYMMRIHGALPEGIELDEGNAFAFQLRPTSPLPGDPKADIWFISGILTLAAGLLIAQRRLGA